MGTRIKEFDSTGVAPNGRLFAGDLLAMEDQYADLFNLLQALGAASISLGESGLQLVRYGAGEARLSGAFRTDGIIRALGGLYAGAFTTTQRNAIPSGLRPYGLVILNTTTNQYEWNAGTDAAPSWQSIGAQGPFGGSDITDDSITYAKLADGISTNWILTGTLASRPAASARNAGSLYFVTDTGQWTRSSGTQWTNLVRPLLTVAQFGSVSVFDGMEVLLQVDATEGVNWHFRYNAASSSPYKWELIGGPDWSKRDDTEVLLSPTSTFQNGSTPGPSFTLPRAGDYEIEVGHAVANNNGGDGNTMQSSYTLGAVAASWIWGNQVKAENTQNNVAGSTRRTTHLNLASGAVIQHQILQNGAGGATFAGRELRVRARRIS